MSVATECVPEVDLPDGYVPSPSTLPRPRRGFTVIPGGAGPDSMGAVVPLRAGGLAVDERPGADQREFATIAPRALVATPVRPLSARAERARQLSAPASEPAGLRLTRRGRLVISVAALAGAIAFVWIGWLSAPHPAGATARPVVPATVTVRAGDTLWSLAQHYLPGQDPRAVVDSLMRLNHLRTGDVAPGQVLRLR